MMPLILIPLRLTTSRKAPPLDVPLFLYHYHTPLDSTTVKLYLRRTIALNIYIRTTYLLQCFAFSPEPTTLSLRL